MRVPCCLIPSNILCSPLYSRTFTGKSSTIVGIVSALLSGKAPLPGQRQSGCLIHPGKVSESKYEQLFLLYYDLCMMCAQIYYF